MAAAACGLLCAVAPALAPAASAQPTDAAAQAGPQPGQKLKDSGGASVGQIERVVPGPDGRPRQIEVRIAGQLRVLPIAGLTRSGDAWASVLSRAELEALPGS